MYTDNGFAFMVSTTTEEAISWLWNAERKGTTTQDWPPSISRLLGAGAVSNNEGKRHRALRRILEPAFAPKATRDYLEVIDMVTCKHLDEWASSSQRFHKSEVFKMYALRLFFVAAFGREGDLAVLHQLHADFKIWLQGFASPIAYRIPGTQFYKSMAARDRILQLVEEMILQFKKENPKESERAKTTMMGRACYGVDEEGNPMKMEDMKDNILNMIFAGHDTTYASIGSAIHFLCEYPSIRTALIDEAKGFQEPLDYDELKSAPVLNAFLAETWRMDPPAPLGVRKLTKMQVYNGYTFPKGISVGYNISLLNKNSDLYPDPEAFNIERFLPANHPLVKDPQIQKASKHVDFNSMKANYPVFGGGLHACIGSHFAKLEMRVLVTRLLQSYSIEEQNPEKLYFPINGWANEFRLTSVNALGCVG